MKKSVIQRIIKAICFSCEGIRAAFISETAFRQELFLCLVGIPTTFGLHVKPGERALLIASLLLVLIVELINSAIEAVVNRISTDIHPLSKRAKDLGSAAVFLTLINAACIWIVILWG